MQDRKWAFWREDSTAMNIDPPIAAWRAFTRVQASDELGDDLETAVAAQELFSSGVGEEVSEAYRTLVALGERHPGAMGFGEFLVYATWCRVMDEPVPEYFKRGASLCRALLQQNLDWDAERLASLEAMERSFCAGLGEQADDPTEYDADTFKGGD